jgi:tRNA pseudouridine55 synthase
VAVELPEAAVQVHAWEVLGYEPGRLHVRISCGTGTYIRALARDLGRLTESAAHLSSLRRLRVGPFDVADADDAEALREGRLRARPLADALAGWPSERLSDDEARRASHGMRVPARQDAARAVLLRPDGEVIAVASRVGEEWQPEVVLADA